MADAEGKLMTKLVGSGRGSGSLSSETLMADGQWHRIGLAWDGSHRTLCVDDVTVAVRKVVTTWPLLVVLQCDITSLY